jgi:ketosteroid isomerase-like protein
MESNMTNYLSFRRADMPAHVLVCLVAASLFATACTTASDRQSPATAEQAANNFLEAFISLDAVRFNEFFAEDATMFFPDGPFPKDRVEGKPAVTAAFAKFFELAKERGASRLNIKPLDLRVQSYGNFAIVTFHLGGDRNIGRRSILFRRDRGNWHIVHFHASALERGK